MTIWASAQKTIMFSNPIKEFIYIYNSIVGENPIKELRKKEKTFL